MYNSVFQDVFQVRLRPRSTAAWAKRAIGLAIVVSGGSLLASDLLRSVQASPASAGIHSTATTPTAAR